MESTVFAFNTATKLAEAGRDADRLRVALAEAAEDSIKTAKRAVRNGRMAAEDFMDEAVFTVKRNPVKSIGVTFGVAFGIGALAGWLARRS
jgi:ElaB/YqjD/DUF883 family membrane-anchored ribosome-binding protein